MAPPTTAETVVKSTASPAPLPSGAEEKANRKNTAVITDSNFKIEKDAFSFENYSNFDGVINLTLIEMKRLFGDSVIIKSEEKPSKEYLHLNAARWMQTVNETMSMGHCEGMAVLSQLFYYNAEKTENFGKGTIYDFNLKNNEKLQREIAYWFTTQFLNERTYKRKISSLSTEQGGGMAAIIDELKKSLSAGKTPHEGWVVGIYLMGGGHAVTPIRLREDESFYYIDVYDSSAPGKDHYISISKSNDGGSTYSAWGLPLDSYDIESIKHRLKKTGYSFPGEISNGNQPNDGIQILARGDVDLAFEDEAGNGIQPEKIILKYTGYKWRVNSSVYVIPAAHKEFTIIMTGKANTGKVKEEIRLDIITPSGAFGIEDIRLGESESDTLKISLKNNKSRAIYRSGDKESPDLTICSKNITGDFEYTIRGMDLDENGLLEVTLDSKTGNTSITSGNIKTSDLFDLLICRLTGEGKYFFDTKDIAIDEDITIHINLDKWIGEGHGLEFFYDYGSDGTIDKKTIQEDINTIMNTNYYDDWETDKLSE